MATPSPGYTDEKQPRSIKGPIGVNYIPTAEEKLVFRECTNESFWYRSVPFSLVSMAVTQALVARGSLSASPRYGSLPKIAFAGFCGYMAGKLSYMKACQEKFRTLNTPLGEALRQQSGLLQQDSQTPQSEVGDTDASLGPMFQPDTQSQTQSRDYGFGYSAEPPLQVEREADLGVSGQNYLDEEEPRQKPILYEDLRLKNRENYEITLTQKAETLMNPASQRGLERPKKDVKKNIYGDAWEE